MLLLELLYFLLHQLLILAKQINIVNLGLVEFAGHHCDQVVHPFFNHLVVLHRLVKGFVFGDLAVDVLFVCHFNVAVLAHAQALLDKFARLELLLRRRV